MEYRKQIDTSDELGQWYTDKYKEMGDGWHTPPEECHRHLDDLGVPFDKSRTLLDIGCGAGHFLVEAQKRCPSVGIDLSDEGIRLCLKRGVNAFKGDIATHNLGDLQFDYIVSIGSLEHIVDLDTALIRIRQLLKPNGKFYFYCPNERWAYFDQPNERTMTDEEWMALFIKHGLLPRWSRRWGSNQDNTAFCGVRGDAPEHPGIVIPPRCSINAGSGQRPFDQRQGWINIDIQDKYGPDIVADWSDLSMFPDNSVECVVAHHTIEHVGCGDADRFIAEAYRVLKQGGSLLVFLPDLRALAERWIAHQIDDYTYIVNLMGAYMGDESDRHKWHYTQGSLNANLLKIARWTTIKPFDWRPIPGADIARDWWLFGTEAVK